MNPSRANSTPLRKTSDMSVSLFLLLVTLSVVNGQLYWLLGWDTEPAAFNSYGLSTSKNSKTLVGAGMRRKNLVVTSVDVYVVGLYLTSGKDREGKRGWSAKSLSSGGSSTVVLQFVRSVYTDKVVGAIADALADSRDKSYQESLEKFKGLLMSGIGPSGVAKGDTLDFNFKSYGSLEIVVNGKIAGTVKNGKLMEKLMSVYVDEKKSVAPELVNALKARY